MYSVFVEEHKRTFDAGNIRDVIDVYLQEYGLDYDSDKLIGLFFSVVGMFLYAYERTRNIQQLRS